MACLELLPVDLPGETFQGPDPIPILDEGRLRAAHHSAGNRGMKDPEKEALIRLSASLALESRETLKDAMITCVEKADPVAAEEVILQSYLFLGYPVALNAFALWREVSGLESPGPVSEAGRDWEKRGAEVCEMVYGGQYRDLRRNIRKLHADMERWMVVEGYGKVLGRPGLTLPVRELCIVALLAVRRLPRQLYSHLRGALNAGAEPREVEEVVRMVCGYVAPEECAGVTDVWHEVRQRWKPGRSGSVGMDDGPRA